MIIQLRTVLLRVKSRQHDQLLFSHLSAGHQLMHRQQQHLPMPMNSKDASRIVKSNAVKIWRK